MSRRVLAVGWDGVDRAVVDELLAAGRLPNLATLLDRGRRREVVGLPGLGDDGTWASFSTGLEPGHHGRFHHVQPEPGTYLDHHVVRTEVAAVPFWAAIADAGRSVAVLDVPKSPMAGRGREVVDWMIHGEDGPVPVTNPPELADDWVRDWSPPPGFSCHVVKQGADELAEHAAHLAARLELRTRAAEAWLGEQPWDLLLVVYAEGHCAGHHFWDRRGGAETMPEGDVLTRTIVSLDAALGRLVQQVDTDETDVLVFSLTGIAPAGTVGDLVEAAVAESARRTAIGRSAPANGFLRRIARRLAPIGRLVPSGLRRRVATAVDAPIADPKGRAPQPWFCLPHDALSTPIRLNRAGREPRGRLDAAAADAALDELTVVLTGLVDAETGRPILTDVLQVAQRYPGPEAHRFADLLAVWDIESTARSATSPTVGRVEADPGPRRPGDHRSGGWMVTTAPGSIVDADPVAVTDLGALVAAACGVSPGSTPS